MSLKRGDTIIEVLFALSVFSLVAILSLNLMNNGVVTAQASLETTMVRNEVNTQAEALRFIHDTVTAGSSDEAYQKAWDEITSLAQDNSLDDFVYPPDNNNDKYGMSCATYYKEDGANNIGSKNAFVLDARRLKKTANKDILVKYNNPNVKFQEAGNYARVIYGGSTGSSSENEKLLTTDINARDVIAAEGIWVIGVPSAIKVKEEEGVNVPQYYDFYIQSCWYNPGKNVPSTIGTVIRLYQPKGVK